MRVRRRQPHTFELIRILREHLDDPPERGAEIGVFAGETSEFLLREFPTLALLMVDAWTEYDPRPGHVNKHGEHKIVSTKKSQRNLSDAINATTFANERAQIRRMPSTEAAADIDDASLDFVFIDADHTYEGVRADIQAWARKVRPGGIVAGHDYGTEHEGTSYGVTRAVDEWVALEGCGLNVGAATVWWTKR